MLKHLSWFLILIVLAGCSLNKAELTTDNKMAKADELFAKGKYARAVELYEEVSFEKKNANASVALMRVADCYFKMNKFTDARLKYTTLTTSYPDFAEVETAWFRIGECYYEESLKAQYDQTETAQCIESFRTFIEKFPESQNYLRAIDFIRKAQYKVIQKKYHNGYIYYKMKDYSSALMYFKEVINLSNTDEIDRKSLYYATKISLYHKNSEDANAFWTKLRERYPESRETRKLARFF